MELFFPSINVSLAKRVIHTVIDTNLEEVVKAEFYVAKSNFHCLKSETANFLENLRARCIIFDIIVLNS